MYIKTFTAPKELFGTSDIDKTINKYMLGKDVKNVVVSESNYRIIYTIVCNGTDSRYLVEDE